MKLKKLLLLFPILTCLTSCTKATVTGEIIDKYIKNSSYTIIQGYGGDNYAGGYGYNVPIREYYFVITFDYNAQTYTKSTEVNESKYYTFNIGDEYTFTTYID